MSQFHDRFKQHPVQGALTELTNGIGAVFVELTDTGQIEGYERFRAVVAFAQRLLTIVDPDLIVPAMLDGLLSQVQTMKAAHDAFVSNKDAAALNQVADQFLMQLYTLPRIDSSGAERAYSDELEGFRGQASKLLDGLKSRVDAVSAQHDQVGSKLIAFEAQLAKFDQNFEAQKSRVDALINEQQSQFAQRVTGYDTQFNDQKARVDTLVTQSQTQFTQSESDRVTRFNQQEIAAQQAETTREQRFAERQTQTKKDFESALDQLREQARQQVGAMRQEFDAFRTEADTNATNARDKLKAYLDEAAKIVGLIANTGLTGNYQRVANEQAKIANLLRWVALGCMGLAIAVASFVVFRVGSADFNWEVGLFRLLGVLTFSIPGWYCARESIRHRMIEQHNRRIELELAALSPYLATLTDDERKRIVTELSGRYFGRDGVQDDGSVVPFPGNRDVNRVVRWIERLLKAVKPI